VFFASQFVCADLRSGLVMRPLVLEEAPTVEAHTAAAMRSAPSAESRQLTVPLEEIPEPALNALVTVEQAARFLQMSAGLVVDLTKWGTIPCLRSGEQRYLRFADVVAHRKELEVLREEMRTSPLDKVRDEIIAGGFDELP